MRYDLLLVGAGLFNAVIADQAARKGKKCLVVERRNHIAGNIYTECVEGIQVHRYGAHIFHTDNREVWDYMNSFAEFNRYTNSPVASYRGRLYNLPFNMNTFTRIWDDVTTPDQARKRIEEQAAEMAGRSPRNLEEQAISLVGRDIYEILIKGYTEKQWGRPCSELPADIIKRLPVRLTFDNNYFNDRYQGIPAGGYTAIVEKMLSHADLKLGTDFLGDRKALTDAADRVVYTGTIDEFYGSRLGNLEYRSLRFETELLDCGNFQGNAVVNYTDSTPAYTRIIEHKHFEFGTQPKTVITREYPAQWKPGDEPYYSVNDIRNSELYAKYRQLSEKEGGKVTFGGRLGLYKYMDMDDTVAAALELCRKIL